MSKLAHHPVQQVKKSPGARHTEFLLTVYLDAAGEARWHRFELLSKQKAGRDTRRQLCGGQVGEPGFGAMSFS
jgi:hypothetical protein